MNDDNTNDSANGNGNGSGIIIPWGFYPHAVVHTSSLENSMSTQSIRSAGNKNSSHINTDAQQPLKQARRMVDETDIAWRARSKHYFVLSNSGKPIWTRYGDENALAGFMAVIQALISFVSDAGDMLRHITLSSDTVAAIKVKGPIYLVTVSKRQFESVELLSRQLDLLHLQFISILTVAVERAFNRSSRFDMRSLLGGTSHIFQSLCRAMHWELGVILRGIQVQKVQAKLRNEVADAMSSVLFRVQMSGREADNEKESSIETSSSSPVEREEPQIKTTPLMGVLFSNHKLLASTVTSEIDKANQPTPWDLLLLMNFVLSSPSFRDNEGFSPICLPEFDNRRFVYCYICFIRPHLCLVLIDETASSFEYLSMARRQFEADIGHAKVDLLERLAIEDSGDYIITKDFQEKVLLRNKHRTILNESSADFDKSDDYMNKNNDKNDDETSTQHYEDNPHRINMGENKGWGVDNTPCPYTTGLWHCCYYNRNYCQYTMPCLPKQFIARAERKLLMEAYTTLQIAATAGIIESSSSETEKRQAVPNTSHRVVFLRSDRFTLVACVSSDLHGMCIFDPCTERAEAVARYHQLSAWIRSSEDLFAPPGSF